MDLSQQKTNNVTGQQITLKMSYTLEPMIQSGDTGQRMLLLTLAIVHNMDIHKDGYHMP